ncbi:MAG: dephospho-CoA kinase [Nitrospirae bacterium]|nr:dephospho-CoA kinase [Nitrospirota bacterium]
MPFVALTGNFGMGKSTVLRLFKTLGAYTIDADELVRDIFKKPETINRIVKRL